MLKPIQLRAVVHPNGGYGFYTVDIIYSVNSTGHSGHKFMTKKDMLTWCDREYHGIPVIVD